MSFFFGKKLFATLYAFTCWRWWAWFCHLLFSSFNTTLRICFFLFSEHSFFTSYKLQEDVPCIVMLCEKTKNIQNNKLSICCMCYSIKSHKILKKPHILIYEVNVFISFLFCLLLLFLLQSNCSIDQKLQ